MRVEGGGRLSVRDGFLDVACYFGVCRLGEMNVRLLGGGG